MAQGFEQLLTIAGFTHHQQIPGQANELLDALANDGVVFSYQYTNHFSRSCPT
jgi:hypothetical protein